MEVKHNHSEEKGKRKLWEEEAIKALKDRPFEALYSSTYEGIKIEPIYTTIQNVQYWTENSYYRANNCWKCSQEIKGETSEEISKQVRYAIERGQNSFYFKNLQIHDMKGVEKAFGQIDISKSSFLIDVGSKQELMPLLFQYFNGKKHDKEPIGTIAFDPFEEVLLKKEISISLSDKYDYLAEAMNWCEENHCQIRCLLIKGNNFHEAGATSLQELVFTFSQALDIINELLNRGVSLTTIAKNTVISFAIGSQFFMEIAKFRAAKHIWGSLLSAIGDRNGDDPLYLHAITSNFNKAAFDIHMNLLRTTTEGFSAVAAGVDELTITPFDYVSQKQDDLAGRIARNIHFIFQEENHLSKVVDPASGSYYIESLTNELANHAWEEIKKIDKNGGFYTALEKGIPQNELKRTFAKRQIDINQQKTTIIGVNKFIELAPIQKKEEREKRKVKKINKIMSKQVTTFREVIQFVEEKNVVPKLLPKIQANQIQILQHIRLIEHFERLRFAAEDHFQRFGHYPKVDVMQFGELRDYKSRFEFVVNLLASGGIEANVIRDFEREYLGNIVVLCGSDKEYQKMNENFVAKLLKCKTKEIYYVGTNKVAGELKGLQRFHMLSESTDSYIFLKRLHQLLGVTLNEAT